MLELIPQWRNWYKRWSTWLLTLVAAINVNDIMGFMPSIQEFMDPQTYKLAMLGLSIATFVALQVKQPSVSGPAV